MTRRTSGFEIYVRAVVVVFLVCCVLGWILNEAIGTDFFSWGFCLAAGIIVPLLFIPSWLGTTLIHDVANKKNPHYQEWRANGGRPYLDTMPGFINPGAEGVRDASVIWTCPRCGEQTPTEYGCPHCDGPTRQVQREINPPDSAPMG